MEKLLNLINPKVILLETEEKELPEEITISETALGYLNERIEILNKKAAKYKVPPLNIVIIKQEMSKVLKPEIKVQLKNGTLELSQGSLTGPGSESYYTNEKRFTIKIEGNPPQIDGYEFIARLEHTAAGNFIYTSPKSSVPNLPSEYKTLNQRCDICNTNRDRNDTFVIKMEKEDIARFPNKKAGDLLVVGRNCLSRFLPGISISGLVMWTKMIDNINDDILAATEMDETGGEHGGGGSGKYYEDADTLLKYLIATYLYTGTYISKKQAQANYDAGHENNSTSTLSRARGEMNPNPFSKNKEAQYPIYYRLRDDKEFLDKTTTMMSEFHEWLKTKDFDVLAIQKPEFADFFNNLKLVSKEEYVRGNHFGFFAALFQMFLKDKNAFEKKKETEKVMAALPPSPIKFDSTLLKKRLRDIAKESEIKRLAAGGFDEKAIKKELKSKEWGWEVEVKKISEYEKTNTFSYGDSGIGYRISFKDNYGNDFLWFSSSQNGFVEGNKYLIDGTIVGYEDTNKYTNRSQTRINRVKIVKDFQNPTLPPQPDAASG